jgi:hypothetical protein
VELQAAEYVTLIQENAQRSSVTVRKVYHPKTKRSMHARLGCQAYNPPHIKTNPLPQNPPCRMSFVNVELLAAESANPIQKNAQW